MAFPTLAPIPHVNGNGRLGTKSHTLSFPPGDFFPIDGNGNTLDRDFLEVLRGSSAYITSVLAHAAMRYRATKLAEAPLIVVDETADGEEWVEGHPLNELLQYPNDDEEMSDLLEMLSVSLDTTGMGLFVKDEDRRNMPGRLMFFDGNEFTVAPTRDRIYGEFRVTAARFSMVEEVLPPERVVFFRIPRPGDRWTGLGPVQVLARWLGIEAQVLTALLHAIPNSVVPGLSVILPDGTTLEQAKDFADFMRASYASARNHARAFVAGDVKELIHNKLGFEGLSGGELYREIESAVCVAFQVRPELLGMMIGLENAPWSHMATAQKLAYDEGIIPLWRRIRRAMTRQLLRPVDDTPDRSIAFDTSAIAALQDDLTEEADRQLKLKGIATKNERRVIAGMEPSDDPEFDEIEAPVPMAAGPEGSPEPGAKLSAKSVPDAYLTWSQFDLETKATSRSWEDQVAKLLATQSEDVRRIFAKYARAMAGQPDEALLADFLGEVSVYLRGPGAAKTRAQLGPMLWATAQSSGKKMATRFGFSFDVVQPGLTRYAAQETAFLTAAMGTTTGEQVARAVQGSLEERETLVQLSKRLEELPAFSRERAQLVARTETTRATNGAQRRTMSEYQTTTSKSVQKLWISSRDERVRDEHAELDTGEWIPVDQEFQNGLQQPGEPNCRCVLGYRITQEA